MCIWVCSSDVQWLLQKGKASTACSDGTPLILSPLHNLWVWLVSSLQKVAPAKILNLTLHSRRQTVGDIIMAKSALCIHRFLILLFFFLAILLIYNNGKEIRRKETVANTSSEAHKPSGCVNQDRSLWKHRLVAGGKPCLTLKLETKWNSNNK